VIPSNGTDRKVVSSSRRQQQQQQRDRPKGRRVVANNNNSNDNTINTSQASHASHTSHTSHTTTNNENPYMSPGQAIVRRFMTSRLSDVGPDPSSPSSFRSLMASSVSAYSSTAPRPSNLLWLHQSKCNKNPA
jgi:hypothetical protein